MENKKRFLPRKIDIGIVLVFVIATIFVTLYSKNTSSDIPYFSYSQQLDFSDVLSESENYTNIWGVENIDFQKDVLEISYPKGSYNPSGSPRGWAGFIYTPSIPEETQHILFSYSIVFDENFDFVKGGKLPGLCGGSCPRWWNIEGDGFSTRFMWRKKGDAEVYGYFPWVTWKSIERWMFTFTTEKQYNISQEIYLNTPSQSDGILRVYVDNMLVYEDTNILYRQTPQTLANKILFSTFFGWADNSWATSINTFARFSNFQIHWN